MKKTILYFIRHGETDYNRKRIVQGRRINSELNQTGRSQAEAVAQRLSRVSVDAIYSSPLRRAAETADIIAERHPDVPVYQLKDLEEISWGIYEGKPATPNIMEELDQVIDRWTQGDFGFAIEEGESILDVQQRAYRALDQILARHAGHTVIVVTHGRFLRVLLASILKSFGLERMHEIHHTNTGVNLITCVEGEFEAELLNCTAHLESAQTIMIE